MQLNSAANDIQDRLTRMGTQADRSMIASQAQPHAHIHVQTMWQRCLQDWQGASFTCSKAAL
jgi:hypothetical protein